MPILSYHERFAAAVETLTKRQTVRAPRRRAFVAGELLYHYANVYRPTQRLIGISICANVQEIVIARRALRVGDAEWTDLAARNAFAVADGLSSWRELINYFENDGALPFRGVLLTWERMLTASEIELAIRPVRRRPPPQETAQPSRSTA